uniref:G_PROTEIN_RECEP_F1_2 domain-containing protein n=1 Tax=Heterorhabditis bacteriophora TaxID=37862 RepID=A0A1I7WZW6_HETBA
MSDTANDIARVSRIVFFTIGAFGNINIILAIYKNKKLQHKCGKSKKCLFDLIVIKSFFRYRVTVKHYYIIAMVLPGICIGLFFVVVSYALMPPNVIREVCVLPFSMPDQVSTWWNHYNMWTSVVTVLIYCLTYFQLYCFSPFLNDPQQAKIQKTILSTLIVQAIVFLFSSVGSAAIIMAMRLFNLSEIAVVDAQTYAVIPGEKII